MICNAGCAALLLATLLLGALLCDTVAAGIGTRADEYPEELAGCSLAVMPTSCAALSTTAIADVAKFITGATGTFANASKFAGGGGGGGGPLAPGGGASGILAEGIASKFAGRGGGGGGPLALLDSSGPAGAPGGTLVWLAVVPTGCAALSAIGTGDIAD